MRQLAVISGKGGTGKTSIVASFAALADGVVVADCDVDAADLFLILDPLVLEQRVFVGGMQATIVSDRCDGCGSCVELCRFGAMALSPAASNGGAASATVDPLACEGCGVCAWFCEPGAVSLTPVTSGEFYRSETRLGPLVHARLAPAAQNSGRLVTLVRNEARSTAEARKLELVIIDGAPGIGCPVIASITGADLVLVVTEPTLSGLHDLERVLDLAEHFGIPSMVLVNKYDINEALTQQVEERAKEHNAGLAGRVRFDRSVTQAQVHRQATVEYSNAGAAEDIRLAWARVARALGYQQGGGAV